MALSDATLAELVDSLAGYRGHRTLWLDVDGQLLHSEPDDELEAIGYTYVATLLRPDADALRDALARHVPATVERRPSLPLLVPGLASA
ncbi:MAG: hypothetical protein KC636_36815 [Myxococcales bacterium]|nr:hypothetical protein [Myxococcales bacterium]